jgi:hypothetical protein
MKEKGLEAFWRNSQMSWICSVELILTAMNNRWSTLVIFLLGNPEILEGGKRS